MKACLPLMFSLFLLSTFFRVAGQQQQEYRLFRGVVLDAETEEALPQAHFRIPAGRGGLTGENGQFALFALPGDTVVFSYMGYKDYSLVVRDSLNAGEYLVGVFMRQDTLMLEEVVIMPVVQDLRTEMLQSPVRDRERTHAAMQNLKISTYQGLTTPPQTGSADENYRLRRFEWKQQAIEKGGIPSGKMIGFNPITLIPAAVSLLSKGLPTPPEPPEPELRTVDIDLLTERYRQQLQLRKDSLRRK